MDFIKTTMPATVDENITSFIKQAVEAMAPYSVSLAPSEKTGKRTMGLKREGHANLINKIALAHPDSLARKDDPEKLGYQLQLDSRIETMRQQAMKILEMITDTQFANSRDIMQTVKTFADALQIGRKNNAALDMAMKEVDEYNKKYAGKNGVIEDDDDEEDTTETPVK